MWSIPKNVRYVVHTKICPAYGPHQYISGICSTPKYVRYVVHTKDHTNKCPMFVPHQTCHVTFLDWGNIMSGMWSTPIYVRYLFHTKICPVCGPYQRMFGLWGGLRPPHTPPPPTPGVRYVVHTKECPVCGPHQYMSGMCSKIGRASCRERV